MEPTGGQPPVERRVDEGGEVLSVEDLARDRDGRLTRNELAAGEDLTGVRTDIIENLLALRSGNE